MRNGTTPRASRGQSLGMHSFLCSAYSHEWRLCFPWALSSSLIVLSQGKKSAAVRQLQSNRMNTGWEGDGGSKTVSLTLLLTLSAPLCNFNRVSLQWGYMDPCKHLQRQQDLERRMEHACLETFPQKSFQGSDIPTEMTGHQSSKALLNSPYGAEFIYFKDIHPLQPTGSTSAQAATRKKVCLP